MRWDEGMRKPHNPPGWRPAYWLAAAWPTMPFRIFHEFAVSLSDSKKIVDGQIPYDVSGHPLSSLPPSWRIRRQIRDDIHEAFLSIVYAIIC
jgi:hypothetical protein